MTYYVEITCLGDEDISPNFIMSKLMARLHLCMVELENTLGHNPVGLGFPKYQSKDDKHTGLGPVVRLFSQEEAHLQSLGLDSCLASLDDYVHVKKVKRLERPKLSYALFKRHQPGPSKERLIRRQLKRSAQGKHTQKGARSEEQLRQHLQNYQGNITQLPYINLKSLSSQRRFRLFVQKESAEATGAWCFNTYGLSLHGADSPVPDF